MSERMCVWMWRRDDDDDGDAVVVVVPATRV